MSTDAEGMLVSLHEASRRIEALTDERDAAIALERQALVAGVVLVRRAREALERHGGHARLEAGDTLNCGVWTFEDSHRGPCTCGLAAALAALDGGGNMREWLFGCALRALLHKDEKPANTGWDTIAFAAADETLAVERPPAIPDATEALADFAAWLMDETRGYEWDRDKAKAAREFAHRWLAGERGDGR